MDNLFRTIGKYLFPALCVIGGLALLMNSSGQPAEVKYGSAAFLLVGVVALLFLFDVIKKPIRIVFTVLFALASVYFLKANTDSISDEIEHQEQVKLNNVMTIQALKDVRAAQEAYHEVNGVFTQDLNELSRFVQSGTLPRIKKINAIHDSIGTEENARALGLIQKMPEGMTDEEVKAAGIIVRDTIQVSVLEVTFNNEKALSKRKTEFTLDNLKYAPSSGKAWDISTGKVNIGGVDQPVLLVIDPEPFDTESEALRIGSMDDAHLNGNWKEN